MATMPNVWTQMNYVAPRGQCNYKQSIVSPKCPCLRFMLHPLKSASSYECDGCNHHASFHSMENKSEDEVRKRWEQEARDKTAHEEAVQQRPKKRVRAIEYTVAEDAGKGAKKTGRAAATRARGKVTEIIEEEDLVVELD